MKIPPLWSTGHPEPPETPFTGVEVQPVSDRLPELTLVAGEVQSLSKALPPFFVALTNYQINFEKKACKQKWGN